MDDGPRSLGGHLHDSHALRGQIRTEVEAAYGRGRGVLADWANPHAWDEETGIDEYSRVTDPGRYLLLGARVDAWAEVITSREIAVLEEIDPSAPVWSSSAIALTERTRLQRLTPRRAPQTTPLFISRQRIEGVADAFVTIGLGEPAEQVAIVPVCGCDACDDGSAPLLEQIDNVFEHVLFGEPLDGLNQPPQRLPHAPWVG